MSRAIVDAWVKDNFRAYFTTFVMFSRARSALFQDLSI
jgi:hypothetical protein